MVRATPDSDWISAKYMTQMLSISRTKTYEILAQEKEIETVQLGRSLRINRASLERWLMKQRYPRWREDHVDMSQGG
jgi:excisionase family DNA binding protein